MPNNEPIDLTRKVSEPMFGVKKWNTDEHGSSFTHLYGSSAPTPSPSVRKLAHLKAEEEYTYLPKNDPIINARALVIEEMMLRNG